MDGRGKACEQDEESAAHIEDVVDFASWDTVKEGNELFKGMSEVALLNYIDLMMTVRRQLRGEE